MQSMNMKPLIDKKEMDNYNPQLKHKIYAYYSDGRINGFKKGTACNGKYGYFDFTNQEMNTKIFPEHEINLRTMCTTLKTGSTLKEVLYTLMNWDCLYDDPILKQKPLEIKIVFGEYNNPKTGKKDHKIFFNQLLDGTLPFIFRPEW